MLLPLMQPAKPTYGFDSLRSAVLPDDWTFTRASAGTYFNADGNLVTAANNEPRFDYHPVTCEPLGLLLEGQATNLAYPSEDFSTSWASTNATETPNVVLAPNGTTTGNSWVRNNPYDDCYTRRQLAKDASSIAQCFSVFAKRGTLGRYLAMRLQGTYPNRLDACFDLETGVVVSSSTSGAGFAATFVNIQAVGGGWYRCIVASSTSDTGTSTTFAVSFNSIASNQIDSTTDPLLCDGYLWGAQFETGTSASSYIPTTTAAVTRAADSLYTTELSWFNLNEGTMFVEATVEGSSTQYIAAFNDTSANNRMVLFRSSASVAQFTVTTGGVFQAGPNVATFVDGIVEKLAGTYKTNAANVAYNGVLGTPDASVTLPTITQLVFAANGTIADSFIHLRSFKYWNRSLSAAELQRITT